MKKLLASRSSTALTFGLSALIILLWATPFVWPFKIVVVGLHEMSHAIAAVLTGGEVVGYSLAVNESGMVLSRGGWRFVFLNAGYLGSLLFGMAILWFSQRTDYDRQLVGLLAVMFIGTLFLRPTLIGAIVSLSVGAGFAALAWRASHFWNDLVLRVLGLVSIVYVPLDILSDVILGSGSLSDASMLAEEYGGHALAWGVLWIGAAAGLIWYAMPRILRTASAPKPRASPLEQNR
ncbi:MAG: M50 family metallopeptidase [Pseudomonadota bacterium]|nr:M50 family metallopeptidase [Pseudomonadota bacterium]